MGRRITSTVSALGLAVAAFFLTTRVSGSQTAAEYRTLTEAAKGWPREAVRGAKAMVASDEELGSKAGVEILKHGGNAVDGAVAVAFALAVVEPAAGNIGGGGFMLVRLADARTTFLDYREVAPGAATRNMYIKPDGKLDEKASVIGYQSVAVPGTVAGLELALKTYGTMKLAEVMEPAIRRGKRFCGEREAGAGVARREGESGAVSREPADFFERWENVESGRDAETAGIGGDAETDCEKWRSGVLWRQDGAHDRGRYGKVGRVDYAAGFGGVQAESAGSAAREVRGRRARMGGADVAATELGWGGDYRSAEYAEGCAAEELGRRGERAHGGRNDAAGVRGPRCVLGGPGLLERAGGRFDRFLLREGVGGDD